MTTPLDISRAKARAKRIARDGDTTHQQALDAVAREAGHVHWGAMLASSRRARDPVGTFLVGMRDHAGTPLDETMHALAEDAIHGYLAEPEGTSVPGYAETYEYRGDVDVTPTEAQRELLAEAITGFMTQLRGAKPAGSDNAMRQTPTLEQVERDARHVMARAAAEQAASGRRGLEIGDWIAERMAEAARKGMARAAKDAPRPTIAPLAMTSDNIAYAMDPEGGPYDPSDRLTVRCPLHADTRPSLAINGWMMRCRAGCDATLLDAHLVERLAEAAQAATRFMVANDASPVVSGGTIGMGGMGGIYTLASKRTLRLETLAARMLPRPDYPRWDI